MQKKKEEETLKSCFTYRGNTNFYKLFAFVHNFQNEDK